MLGIGIGLLTEGLLGKKETRTAKAKKTTKRAARKATRTTTKQAAKLAATSKALGSKAREAVAN
jgi:hypothetical protein